jgi:hypothetical protein
VVPIRGKSPAFSAPRASAYSPAASALVARLNPAAKQGRAFGSYGFAKSIGHRAGLGSARLIRPSRGRPMGG